MIVYGKKIYNTYWLSFSTQLTRDDQNPIISMIMETSSALTIKCRFSLYEPIISDKTPHVLEVLEAKIPPQI